MNNTYPGTYIKALAQLIRDGDREGFINLRYPYIQEAEPFVFENEDFRNTDITKFPAIHNFCYVRCGFKGAAFGSGNGSMWTGAKTSENDIATGLGLISVAFVECDMRGVDLSHTRASACQFYKCDLSGAVWSEHTRLGWPDTTLSCLFDETVLDTNFREFLEKQGVKFGVVDQNMIARSYDLSENCIFDPKDTADLQELLARYPE